MILIIVQSCAQYGYHQFYEIALQFLFTNVTKKKSKFFIITLKYLSFEIIGQEKSNANSKFFVTYCSPSQKLIESYLRQTFLLT